MELLGSCFHPGISIVIFWREKQNIETCAPIDFFKNVVFAGIKAKLLPVSFMGGIKWW